MPENVFTQARQCTLCRDVLPYPPNPVFQGSSSSKIVIIGQAPGRLAHHSCTPWNDPSGDRLRTWLGIDRQVFYCPDNFALIPMGFCYPGTGKSGDLPPRPECAAAWHDRMLATISPRLCVLVGQYAQKYYLGDKLSVSQRTENWHQYWPRYFVCPHPSPRNNRWLKQRPWFEADVLPHLRHTVHSILGLV